ncbi:MAG TPA: hypothetical protein VFJ60_09195 [Gaiella sp.]|nr:hypothetical protein [Gaiella sp.]
MRQRVEPAIERRRDISRFAPFRVFVADLVSGLRDRVGELAFMAAIVTTVAVIGLY